jgi:hypothetical protein
MNKCEECGKKMGFLEGYSHPTLGKKILVCSQCFVKVDESVTRWSEFIRSNSFNPEPTNSASNINWRLMSNNIITAYCSKFYQYFKIFKSERRDFKF